MNRIERFLKGTKEYRQHRRSLWRSFFKNLPKVIRIKIISVFTNRRPVIAVSLIEHFGDIVACEPVSRYLKKTYPNCYLIWFVRHPYRELLDTNPYIDAPISVNCLSEWILFIKTGLYDKKVDLHIEERHCAMCDKTLRKENKTVTYHTFFLFGGLLTAFSKGANLPLLTDAPNVYITEKVRTTVDELRLPKNIIVVHCAANESFKDWDIKKWEQLFQTVNKFHPDITIVEVGLAPTLSELNLKNYTHQCGNLSLLETAEVIRRANLFIGIDSGPAHLANAVNTFGIILLGSYHIFKTYTPYTGNYATGKNATILRSDTQVSEIDANKVYTAVDQAIALRNRQSETVS
jgi:heptosyltransferase III